MSRKFEMKKPKVLCHRTSSTFNAYHIKKNKSRTDSIQKLRADNIALPDSKTFRKTYVITNRTIGRIKSIPVGELFFGYSRPNCGGPAVN